MYGSTGSGWMYNYDKNDRLFWWKRLMEDDYFKNLVLTRWTSLRESRWSNERIFADVDSMVTTMGAAVNRNYTQWPVLGVHVWPNVFVGDTYISDLNYLKGWLTNRLSWMDTNLTGSILQPTSEISVLDDEGKILLLKLNQDYFNKKKLTNKHFKWADNAVGPEIDTVLYQSASQAQVVLKTSVYNAVVSLALKVDKDVLNSFSNLTSNLLAINNLENADFCGHTEAFYLDGSLNLRTQSPESMDPILILFNILGQKVGTYQLEKAQIQTIPVQLPAGHYLLRLHFNQFPVTIKLIVR